MRTGLLLAACLIVLPASAQGAKSAAPAAATPKVDWDGEWSLVASKSDNLTERIDEHVKDMNFALRLFWKKKLQNACQAYDHLDILAGDSFSVTLGRERPIDTPTDGTVTDWKSREDDTYKASLTKDGPTLIQTLQSDGPNFRIVYSMRPDGHTMAVQITYSHPKLDNPFSYKLVFKRAD